MLLGVPSVSSDVGGVKNLMVHEKEGYVYQSPAPYMLAYYVKKLLADPSLAAEMGKNAQKHAKVTHSRRTNTEMLTYIYSILDKN